MGNSDGEAEGSGQAAPAWPKSTGMKRPPGAAFGGSEPRKQQCTVKSMFAAQREVRPAGCAAVSALELGGGVAGQRGWVSAANNRCGLRRQRGTVATQRRLPVLMPPLPPPCART